jgi:hypothetical protein
MSLAKKEAVRRVETKRQDEGERDSTVAAQN